METAVLDVQIMQFNNEQKEPVNVMQELQQQRESLKQNLHEMDKSIKKLTGRDHMENRRNQVENRRQSTIKRVPLKRESIGSPGDIKPSKRLSTEKRRWGNTAFSRNNELDSGGEEKVMKKPTVQSSVVVTGKPIEPLHVKKEDVTMKKRNKRMFSLLLGTLKQFKEDAKMKTETESKQEEKMIQVEEKVQREKEEVAERKKDLMETRYGKKLELEELEFKIAMAELNQELKSHYDQFTDFIQLKSTPCIFYKPAEHNEKTEILLRESQTCLKESLEQRLKEISMCTEEDIQTARVPWDSSENKILKLKSRRDHPESHRLFRYGDERVSNTGKQSQHRKKSISSKAVSEPIVIDHLSSKKDRITVDDDEREKVTVIVEDTVNLSEDVNEPVNDSLKVVVDLGSDNDNDTVLPDVEISSEVVGNKDFSYVDWGKFNHDDDDHDNDTGNNARPNFLDLSNDTQRCNDSDKNDQTPIEIEESDKDHESETDIGKENNEIDSVNENDEPRDEEGSFNVDKDVDGFEALSEHNRVSDHIESHTQVEGHEDMDVAAQSSCKADDSDDIHGKTEVYFDRGQAEQDIQDSEPTEKDITDDEQTEKDVQGNKQTEKEIADNVLTKKYIVDNELTKKDITDSEQTELNIQGDEHVQEIRDVERDIHGSDHTHNDEIECRNIFTDILPVVINNNQCASAEDLFPQNEYADQLLEQVVDQERAFISPPGVVSPYNVIDERLLKKSLENQTLPLTNDIDTRTESDVTLNTDTDFTATEDEYSIGLFAKEYSSWQQG